MPGRPPALPREPDEVGGPPGDGGQGLQVQLVAGAEVVLAERGGRAAVHTALAAGGRQVGQQLLQHGNLDNRVFKITLSMMQEILQKLMLFTNVLVTHNSGDEI